jgi:ABC-type transport system involved in multi-copper enzyme maturation permease subunit
MKPTTRALLEDAWRQILDNTVFRILTVVTVLLVLPTFLVAATPEGIDVLFGLWKLDYADFGPGFGRLEGEALSKEFVRIVQEFIVQGLAGTVGVFFCIAATAFFVPRMLEKGAADVVFSRPISRATLLMSRWFAGVLFVALLSLLLVGGMHLGFLLRSGHSDPGFLGSALTLTYLFAILHCLSTMVAVFTRSSVAAILVTVIFFPMNSCLHSGWGLKEAAFAAREARMAEGEEAEEPSATVRTLSVLLDVVHWVLPKTNDADALAASLRTAVLGADHVVRDAQTDLLVAEDFQGASLSAPTADLGATPAVWRATRPDGEDHARVELKRVERQMSREQKNGRERLRKQSARQAADAFEDSLSGSSTRRETRSIGAGLAVELVAWREDGVDGMERERAYLADGEWMYSVDMSTRPNWFDEPERERRRKEFLEGLSFDRASAEIDPVGWRKRQFGWTAPPKHNAFLSIGTTLAFCALLMALALWRLRCMDF